MEKAAPHISDWVDAIVQTCNVMLVTPADHTKDVHIQNTILFVNSL